MSDSTCAATTKIRSVKDDDTGQLSTAEFPSRLSWVWLLFCLTLSLFYEITRRPWRSVLYLPVRQWWTSCSNLDFHANCGRSKVGENERFLLAESLCETFVVVFVFVVVCWRKCICISSIESFSREKVNCWTVIFSVYAFVSSFFISGGD